jgi:hypothetical protein
MPPTSTWFTIYCSKFLLTQKGKDLNGITCIVAIHSSHNQSKFSVSRHDLKEFRPEFPRHDGILYPDTECLEHLSSQLNLLDCLLCLLLAINFAHLLSKVIPIPAIRQRLLNTIHHLLLKHSIPQIWTGMLNSYGR